MKRYEIMMKNISKEEIYMDKIWLQLSWTNYQNASKRNKLINASYQLWHTEESFVKIVGKKHYGPNTFNGNQHKQKMQTITLMA